MRELDDLRRTAEKLQALHSAMQEARMNRVLYMLTVVTTMFVPVQFLTGLWGMNFDNMPELHYEWSPEEDEQVSNMFRASRKS